MLIKSWLIPAIVLAYVSTNHAQVTSTNWNPSTGSGTGNNGNPFTLPSTTGGLRPATCNGSSLFCSLRFDQYTFASTWRSGSYNLEGDCASAAGFPTSPGNACPVFTAGKCFFQNHGNRDLIRQLNDGIRSFNFQLCSAGVAPQYDYARLCKTVTHTTYGTARALGEDFMDTAEVLKYWLNLAANRNEVIELEFDEIQAPIDVNMQYVIDQLEEKIGVMLLRRTDTTRAWPSLGAMIRANKRVVVFVTENIFNALTATPPNWLLRQADYYLPSSFYTQTTMPPDTTSILYDEAYDSYYQALVANVPYTIAHFCKHPDNGLLAGRWQNIDMEWYTNYRCPLQVANAIQYFGRQIAFFCLKYTYFHRFRTMTYYVGMEIKSLVRRINLARYALLLQAVQNQQTVSN